MPRASSIASYSLLAVVTGSFAYAQLQPATAEHRPDADGQRRIPIHVLDYSDASRLAPNISQVIVSELRASGRFILIEPDSGGKENVDIDTTPQFDKWRSLNAEWIVIGRVTPQIDQNLKVEFRLWNIAGHEQVLGKQYWLTSGDRYGVAHAIAESIINRLTGENVRFD
jgi:TolB protein